jgi:hypothetical protein
LQNHGKTHRHWLLLRGASSLLCLSQQNPQHHTALRSPFILTKDNILLHPGSKQKIRKNNYSKLTGNWRHGSAAKIAPQNAVQKE